jgi:hypothetical protein
MSREHMLNFFRAVVAGVDGTVALEEVEGKLIKINEAQVENLTREQFLRIFNRPGVFLKLTFVKEGEEESFKLLTVSSDGHTRPGRIFLSSHW